jgi:hypothetical protein
VTLSDVRAHNSHVNSLLESLRNNGSHVWTVALYFECTYRLISLLVLKISLRWNWKDDLEYHKSTPLRTFSKAMEYACRAMTFASRPARRSFSLACEQGSVHGPWGYHDIINIFDSPGLW